MQRSQRNFYTRYAVPERPGSDVRFNGTHAESGPTQDEREPFVELLLGEGFKEVVRLIILPYVRDLRKALLRSADMPENQRQRLIGSLSTIEHIVTQIFQRAGEPLPEWLANQFK